MNNEERDLFTARGLVASLPEAEKKQCEELAAKLREEVKQAGAVGLLAFALVALEVQNEQS